MYIAHEPKQYELYFSAKHFLGKTNKPRGFFI